MKFSKGGVDIYSLNPSEARAKRLESIMNIRLIESHNLNNVYQRLRREVKKIGAHIKTIKYGGTPLRTKIKLDKSGCTKADLEAQEMYNRFIRSLFPDKSNHLIIGEETDLETLEKEIRNFHGEYIWVIDPLDGTKNFIEGENSYCTAITLLARGLPIFSFLYFPEYDLDGKGELLAEARENRGEALVNGKKVQVANEIDLSQRDCVIYVSSKVAPEPYYPKAADIFNKVIYNRGGSGLVNMVRIAASGIYPTEILYLKPTPSIWDIIHGIYFLSKAGGITTYSDGGYLFPLDLNSFDFSQTGSPRLPSIIAGSPQANRRFLEAIKRSQA